MASTTYDFKIQVGAKQARERMELHGSIEPAIWLHAMRADAFLWDRYDARILGKILTHFADTGELLQLEGEG